MLNVPARLLYKDAADNSDVCSLKEECPLRRSRSPCHPILYQNFRVCSYQQHICASLMVQPRGENFQFMDDLFTKARCVPTTQVKSGGGDCMAICSVFPITYEESKPRDEVLLGTPWTELPDNELGALYLPRTLEVIENSRDTYYRNRESNAAQKGWDFQVSDDNSISSSSSSFAQGLTCSVSSISTRSGQKICQVPSGDPYVLRERPHQVRVEQFHLCVLAPVAQEVYTYPTSQSPRERQRRDSQFSQLSGSASDRGYKSDSEQHPVFLFRQRRLQ